MNDTFVNEGSIKIYFSENYLEIPYNSWFFPGGEQGITIDITDRVREHVIMKGNEHCSINVNYVYYGDTSFMLLLQAVDAVKRALISSNNNIKLGTLYIPYFPAARQDRVCNTGESLTAKVYADLVNSMNFSEVVVLDPHSDVVPALLNNARVVSNLQFSKQVLTIEDANCENSFIISPDAGANKKCIRISHANNIELIRCDKNRDLSTGKILETIVYADDLEGKNCYIFDDIASYGGTFMGISAALKLKNAGKIVLAVSHFEGVANLNHLKNAGIDQIYTTDSRKWNMNGYNDKGIITNISIQNLLSNNR